MQVPRDPRQPTWLHQILPENKARTWSAPAVGVVALEENKHEHLNTLGIALCRNAQYDEAISVLERSLALSVDDGVSLDLLFLALAHAGKGDTKTAHDYYTRAKASFDARSGVLTKTYRDEFSRLYNEARAAIAP